MTGSGSVMKAVWERRTVWLREREVGPAVVTRDWVKEFLLGGAEEC